MWPTSVATSCSNRGIVGSDVLFESVQWPYLENQKTAVSVKSSESAVSSWETDPLEVVTHSCP
jgi:hypothetical protein